MSIRGLIYSSRAAVLSAWRLAGTGAKIGVIFSALLISGGVFLGLWDGDGGESGLVDKKNWTLYPVFFLLIGWLAQKAWHPFLDAWKEFEDTGLLVKGDRDIEKITSRVTDWQYTSFFLAIVLGSYLSFVDAGCVAKEYDKTFAYEWWPQISFKKCDENKDFFTAFDAINDYSAYIGTVFSPGTFKTINKYYAIAWYIAQGLLGALAFQALFNISIQQIEFVRSARSRLRLNPFDPMREFGLGTWNRSLNNAYAVMAICMVVPMVSALEQPPLKAGESPDFGQIVLQLAVPLMFLVPLVLGIIGRQVGLDNAKARIQEQLGGENGAEEIDERKLNLFHQQSLWPFDRSIGGKFAFSVILVEYGVLAPDMAKIITRIF